MEDTSMGALAVLKTTLGGAAAGFAFAESALFALNPILTEDHVLLSAATLAAVRAGSTGVGVVMACLIFTSLLISLGSGFLLAALVMKLLTGAGEKVPWLREVTAGASVVVGAVVTGVLAGLLPPWMYITAQGILILIVYSHSNVNDMTQALLIIFTTLFLSVYYGRMGVIIGLFLMGLTISFLCALRKALTERMTRRPKSTTECKLLERIFFYSVVVGILGFMVGLGAGTAWDLIEAEMLVMVHSVLWVAFLSAGLLGAGLGTVAMVGLGPEAAGKVALGAALISSLALRVLLSRMSFLGARSSMAGVLGAATAAGVSLGAASVGAKQAFKSRNSALATFGSVVAGVILATQVVAVKATLMTTSELITITLVAMGAFVLGAPQSPFHTQVNLRRGLLTGPELITGIGMETVTAAAAPIGAGALGAAAIGTAALGKLGTTGVLVAITLALGSILSGMMGKSQPTASVNRD